MRASISSATKVCAMILFSCFISFFVYISFYVMIKQFSTEVIGYEVYDTVAKEKIGELTEKPETLEENRYYQPIYSKMPLAAEVVLSTLQVICGVGVVFCTAGSVIAKEAARDRNDADFNNAESDKLKGLKIGVFAAIPSLLIYVGAMIFKFVTPNAVTNMYFWVYRWIILCPVKPIVDLMTDSAINFQTAKVGGLAATVVFSLLIVAFCAVMYIVCYNEDSVIAKVLYKSTKKEDNTRRLRSR